jgi:flagellar basal-body rod protein FlgF
MENPSYIVLSQQKGLQRQMEVIANNLANTNTPAFKAERLMFIEFLTSKANNPGVSGDGARVSFLGQAGTLADMREGMLESTFNMTDFALKGPGYFVVDTPNGPRYTRDGHFEIDGNSRLVNRDGYPVMGVGNQPLNVPAGVKSIEVTPTGGLGSDKGDIGKLQVVKFDNEVGLRKTGQNLFETDETPQAADTSTLVQQGLIEASNVQPILELTKMIEVQRSYQSAQNMLQQEYDRSRKAIQTFTRVS